MEFDSDTDTRYFNEKYTKFPIDQISSIYTTGGDNWVEDYTFVGDEFCLDEHTNIDIAEPVEAIQESDNIVSDSVNISFPPT